MVGLGDGDDVEVRPEVVALALAILSLQESSGNTTVLHKQGLKEGSLKYLLMYDRCMIDV